MLVPVLGGGVDGLGQVACWGVAADSFLARKELATIIPKVSSSSKDTSAVFVSLRQTTVFVLGSHL